MNNVPARGKGEGSTVSLNVSIFAVQCKYYDNNLTYWMSDGCSVVNSSADWTVCSCPLVESKLMFGASNVQVEATFDFKPYPVLNIST
jgi:hypothetical protein